MTKIVCDKCGREMAYAQGEATVTINRAQPNLTRHYDLCPNCATVAMVWLVAKEPVPAEPAAVANG